MPIISGAPTIFKCTKPQEHQAKAVSPSIVQNLIKPVEVEDAFYWFYIFPSHTSEYCVDVRSLQFRPCLLHECRAAETGIMQFSWQHQERSAIDNELTPARQPSEMRNRIDCSSISHGCRVNGYEKPEEGTKPSTRASVKMSNTGSPSWSSYRARRRPSLPAPRPSALMTPYWTQLR